ncbi:MAG: fructose-bisphosphate aldolase class I [Proteobacteria bacterium]|nr:fructose-bisphosphate aldolase class I [Pseudomonadota bacterium]MDE3208501.1 fructose-bisphosphate aldolase class I [Pseudomonadota bacterium]
MSLSTITEKLLRQGHGLLAADESLQTIHKRFAALGIEQTEENRRAWRDLLVTTPNISEFISGVILYEETLEQLTDENIRIPEFLTQVGIEVGIKVDQGTKPFSGHSPELITEGLDKLNERLTRYHDLGATFAKWRAVYMISSTTPSDVTLIENARLLARYALACQEAGLVPIVEPEVLMDGDHDVATCSQVTEKVLHHVFENLHLYHVAPENILLKPSMILPGKNIKLRPTPEATAHSTLNILRRCVPVAVPGICFLSGGQSETDATANLNAMKQISPNPPWKLSFSYARALQNSAMKAWGGHPKNKQLAQTIFSNRAKLNSLASQGLYKPSMEI